MRSSGLCTKIQKKVNYLLHVLNLSRVKHSRKLFEAIMATTSGRILHPSNFAKEIFLRFNLPPVHTLMHNMVPDLLSHELFDKTKEFIRGADSDHRQLRKLNFPSTSASLGNFRRKEEEKFLGVFEKVQFLFLIKPCGSVYNMIVLFKFLVLLLVFLLAHPRCRDVQGNI